MTQKIGSLFDTATRTGLIEHANGTRVWYRDGKLHREDGPAVAHANGTRLWCRDGKLQRDDGPAIEWRDSQKLWYRAGLLDGPAVAQANGMMKSYRNGDLLHRGDGPVIVYATDSIDRAEERHEQMVPRLPAPS